jgi:hypothetical protein
LLIDGQIELKECLTGNGDRRQCRVRTSLE